LKTFLLIFAGVIIFYLILSTIIVTEEERVIGTLRRAESLVEAEDIGIIDIIDSEFYYQMYQYDDLRANIPSFFDRFDRIKIDLGDLKVSVFDTLAICSLKARIFAWADSMPVLLFGEVLGKSLAVVHFTKNDDRWLIRGIDVD